MQRKATLVILITIAAVLSGCLNGDDADPAPTDTTTSTEDTNGNVTTSPPETTEEDVNAAPVPELTADLTTGDAPLLVTFAIAGDDADGDALTWTLDADGDGTSDADGTEVPGTFAFNYTAAGNYSALLTMSDGTDEATATLNLTISEAAPPTVTLPEPITFSDTITGAYAGQYVAVEAKEHTWSFAPAGVTNMTISVSHDSPGAIDLDWTIYAPDGTEVIERATYNVPGGLDAQPVNTFTDEEAPVSIEDLGLLSQTGDWRIAVNPGEAVAGDYTVTISFA